MSGSAVKAAARRLTPAQEDMIVALLADGLTEREVAARVGVGPATVNRVRKRHQAAAQDSAPAAPAAADAGGQDPAGTQVAPEPDGASDSVLESREGALAEAEAVLAGARAGHEQAAAKAAEATAEVGRLQAELTECERLRRECLAARQSTRDVADRREQAEYDLEQATTAADGAQAALEQAGIVLGEAQAARDGLAAAIARAEAEAEAEALAPVARDSLRQAAMGELAVGELVRIAQELDAAERRCGVSMSGAVLPPGLPFGTRDPWLAAVTEAWRCAQAGNLAACQRALVALGGTWRDPQVAEAAQAEWDAQAAERARIEQERFTRGMELAAKQQAGRGPVTVPEQRLGARVFMGPPAHLLNRG